MLLVGTASVPLPAWLDLPVGTRVPTEDRFTDVADEPHARAVVFDDTYRQVAVVSADLFLVDADLIRAAAERVHAAVGIIAERVFIVPTHNLGAPLCATLPGLPKRDAAYCDYLAEMLATAAIYAARARRPAAVGWRRSAAGVLVCRVDDEAGRTAGLVAELTTLPSQTGRVLTADYPGALVRFVERQQVELDALGLLGAAAGAAPAVDDPQAAGERLGALAWAAAQEVVPELEEPLRVASSTVALPLERPDPAAAAHRLQRAEQRLNEPLDSLWRRPAQGEFERAERALAIARGQAAAEVEVELTAVRIGAGLLLFSPLLLSASAGALARERSACGELTLPVSGGRGCLGLLTTADDRLLGLEDWYAPVPFADAAAERWADAVAALTGRLD